ncbi:unnamed protein product [Didymodactylos carnosus]|uniref:Uncharacterized protein n=1 Tax=Didymodactylos carnosus TaxID=1234261 RepID=A0A8S2GLA6_9BILA|nr:unnamed protein product [Didymodactylos carnosus]CAF3534480.1 unnamed protein product [Didymodactylos carnosus]
MMKNTGSINLSYSPGRPRTVRTKAYITKAKCRLNQKKHVSTRKLAAEKNISRRSAQRILREDLGCFPYKKNGVYNVQNDRVWAVNRNDADKRRDVHEKTMFPVKVMVWLGVCSEGFTVPVILETGTLDVERYMKDILPVALKCGNKMLGMDWTYQQDGAIPHTHHLNQKWCADHFFSFIPKDRWPPNSPDLCSIDYSLWHELGEAMNWNHVTTKATLIDEIKRSVKKINAMYKDTFCFFRCL